MLQHLLSDLEIGDHAVLHRADGGDVAGRASEHFFRVRADRTDLLGRCVDRDYTGLAQDDTLVFCKHECVCSA